MEMEMNKSHATMFLVFLIGNSDGKWSEEEMKTAINFGTLKSAVHEAPDWGTRIENNELNETTAIEILNKESREVQMECLINVYFTAASDGVFTKGEINVLGRIIGKLNKGITITGLLNACKARLNS
jgi:hypothetical protein